MIVDLPLCRVVLQDERHYPWLILFPRREGVSRMMDLSFEDQVQLLRELDLAQKALWAEFSPTQLNVAAIGNRNPKLHLHVIARFEGDPAWPGTVWDHPVRAPYAPAEFEAMAERLQRALDVQHQCTFDKN